MERGACSIPQESALLEPKAALGRLVGPDHTVLRWAFLPPRGPQHSELRGERRKRRLSPPRLQQGGKPSHGGEAPPSEPRTRPLSGPSALGSPAHLSPRPLPGHRPHPCSQTPPTTCTIGRPVTGSQQSQTSVLRRTGERGPRVRTRPSEPAQNDSGVSDSTFFCGCVYLHHHPLTTAARTRSWPCISREVSQQRN